MRFNLSEDNQVNDLHITASEFKEDLEFRTGKFRAISITGGIISRLYYSSASANKLNILNGTPIKELLLYGGVIDNFEISSSKINRLRIKDTRLSSFITKTSNVEIQELELLRDINYSVQLDGVVVDKLNLSNISNKGEFYIQNCTLNKIELRYFDNNGRFDLAHVKPRVDVDSFFIVIGSTLGYIIFKGFKFSEYKRIIIRESFFSEIKMVGEYIRSHKKKYLLTMKVIMTSLF